MSNVAVWKKRETRGGASTIDDDHSKEIPIPPVALFFTSVSRDTFLETGANEVNPSSLRTVKRKENQISLRDEED